AGERGPRRRGVFPRPSRGEDPSGAQTILAGAAPSRGAGRLMSRSWKTIAIHPIMEREIERAAAAYAPRGRLVDIGCGTKPYEALLRRYVTEHVGVDRPDPFNETARVDLVGTAYTIPAEAGSFAARLHGAVP